MIKVMIFIKRRADLSLEAFREHYETVHVPLSLTHLPLMQKHARNYVIRRPDEPEGDYDVVTECWFESWETLKATAAVLAEKRPIFQEDEERFMDRASIRSVTVDESVTWQAGAQERNAAGNP